MSLEEVKRSTRTRKLSSRVRVFDEHTRAEITRKKLDALEKLSLIHISEPTRPY